MFRSIVVLAVIASPAFAANRHCSTGYCAPVVAQQVAYPQTIIQNQNVFYSVGENVRQYSVTPQAVAEANKQYLARQIQGLQDQLAEYQTQQAYQPQQVCYVPVQAVQCPPGQQPYVTNNPANPMPAEPQPKFNQTVSVMASCIKCHGASGKDREFFDLTKPLSCDDQTNALAAVATGEMPKGARQPFTADELKQLKAELRGWNQQHGWGEKVQPPTPPQAAPVEGDGPVPKAPEEGDDPKFSNATRDWLRFAMQKR